MWGGGFVAVKDAVRQVPPFAMIAVRFLVASAILAVVFFPRLRKITRSDVRKGAIVGAVLFAGFAFQTTGARYTLASKSAFITGCNIVLVPFLVWLFKGPKPRAFQVVSALICFTGIGLLTLEDVSNFNLGDALTLVCGVMFALHITLVGFLARDNDTIVLSITQMFFAGVLSLVCSLAFDPPVRSVDPGIIGSVAYITVFSTCAAFLIQNVAQRYTKAAQASLLLGLESFFGPVLAVLMLGDPVTPRMVGGGLLVLGGIFLSEMKTGTSPEPRGEKA